jgi:anti-sigma B factor antagonist
VEFSLEASHVGRDDAKSIVLVIGGTIDASTTASFERRLEEYVNGERSNLIIDLSQVIYISSSGWGIIVKYMQDLNRRGLTMALAGMNPVIFRIFRDLGFEPLIPHYLTVERAEEGMAAPGGGDTGTGKRPASPARGAGDSSSIIGKDEAAAIVVEDEPASPVAEDEPTAPVAEDDSPSTVEENVPTSGEDAASGKPFVEKRGVSPFMPGPREKTDEPVVHLDFGDNTDVSEDTDVSIRDLGWDEYGRKLSERNKRKRDKEQQR